MNIKEYLIDHEGIDLTKALSAWSWLLPSKFTVWLINKFGEMCIVLEDGSVCFLSITDGTFDKIANDEEEFYSLIDDDENTNRWFAVPLVDKLKSAGINLNDGQCYGFKKPLVFGGNYTIDNIAPFNISDCISAYGSIHRQIKDLPDGSQVAIKIDW